ncbi:MAG TPA: PilZ domain-containing protein [Candidatus Acidoferrales bacterium]|nr:PilZ domain-containing protein [Candidatus Acidoferrales bacterium]
MTERTSNPENASGEGEGSPERRVAQRHIIVALADVTEIRSGERIMAQTTQLSANGCYMGAMNTFAEGTEVRVKLSKGGQTFQTNGRVLNVHAEFGMGIVFENTPAEQQRMLDGWLAETQR